jgi:dTDP-4-amino-4,6-dideoxygalactose transaminase
MDHLSGHGIDSRTLFSSMPTQCAGFRFLGYREGDFPEAEYIGKNGFHIGVHQDLGKKECDYFLKLLKNFISNKNHL